MAHPLADPSAGNAASPTDNETQSHPNLWRKLAFWKDKDHGGSVPVPSSSFRGPQSPEPQGDPKSGSLRRAFREVVPGLPRAQTFKRQQSERRNQLEPVQPSPAERRAVSVDRRAQGSISASYCPSNPRTSAPDFLSRSFSAGASAPSLSLVPDEHNSTSELAGHVPQFEIDGVDDHDGDRDEDGDPDDIPDDTSNIDGQSVTSSQYEQMIHEELEHKWILNLSMHFRDKSKREKFFVTYREHNTLWRRVTISLDYRNAPDNSLEMELVQTKFQRDKSAKIYEAIRESLSDIQFYDTVTNLKLQTTEGRLHVHVVEDVNEIINYPTVRMIQHMRCRRIKERDLEFDSHMSGFVYKVRVNGEVLIKKEIPGPDTVEEFLYEINALNRLRSANNVIHFYGVVVDDKEELVKGLLISYAEQGALIDVIYDNDHTLPWQTRERWARQIVSGLSEIHEAGFVQGDFTLSNIVINDRGDAKIIDINRRGCPVGWEPPEATPLIESNQRISMYIGVKSDLYQLGMVLWALATQEDEPEAHGRPLRIGPEVRAPAWYRRVVDICLSDDPRNRLQALDLLSLFQDHQHAEESRHHRYHPGESAISVDDSYSRHHDYLGDSFVSNGNIPRIKTIQPSSSSNEWGYGGSWGANQYANPSISDDHFHYPTRGRSPPSPMPSNNGDCDPRDRYGHHRMEYGWSGGASAAPHSATLGVPSYNDRPLSSQLGGTGSEADFDTSEEVLRHPPTRAENRGSHSDGEWNGAVGARRSDGEGDISGTITTATTTTTDVTESQRSEARTGEYDPTGKFNRSFKRHDVNDNYIVSSRDVTGANSEGQAYSSSSVASDGDYSYVERGRGRVRDGEQEHDGEPAPRIDSGISLDISTSDGSHRGNTRQQHQIEETDQRDTFIDRDGERGREQGSEAYNAQTRMFDNSNSVSSPFADPPEEEEAATTPQAKYGALAGIGSIHSVFDQKDGQLGSKTRHEYDDDDDFGIGFLSTSHDANASFFTMTAAHLKDSGTGDVATPRKPPSPRMTINNE